MLVGEHEREDAHPDGRKQEVVAAGHLADDDQRRERSLRGGREKASHAEDHVAGGFGNE